MAAGTGTGAGTTVIVAGARTPMGRLLGSLKDFSGADLDSVAIAGGMESMTRAPHFLPKSREGTKFGDMTLVDHMSNDGLWDVFIEPSDLDLVEINEAFASVALQSMGDLGLSEDIVNGGAIALGHPIGMSGARVVLHLALELQRRGGDAGAAALCGGGGQGDAFVIRVPATG